MLTHIHPCSSASSYRWAPSSLIRPCLSTFMHPCSSTLSYFQPRHTPLDHIYQRSPFCLGIAYAEPRPDPLHHHSVYPHWPLLIYVTEPPPPPLQAPFDHVYVGSPLPVYVILRWAPRSALLVHFYLCCPVFVYVSLRWAPLCPIGPCLFTFTRIRIRYSVLLTFFPF